MDSTPSHLKTLPTPLHSPLGLFPILGSTPGTTRRSADKAGPPQTQTPSLPPAHHTPSDTTACPSRNQCSLLPPQPPQSNQCPSPPGPLLRKSYTNTICDITALVNLAKTMPDLPLDRILVMHKASLPRHPINGISTQ
jgi:hypothetical protein